jgi:hypothetical protein
MLFFPLYYFRVYNAHSWMKYYNSELESSNRNFDEKVVKELLDNVKKSIDKSLTKLGKQMSKR